MARKYDNGNENKQDHNDTGVTITAATAAAAAAASDSMEAWSEAWQLIHLIIPTVVIDVGCTMANLIAASYIGRHLGSVYLDGFTLAMLTGNLLTLSLLFGLYSASDTLSPQAFGAGNYKEVGLIAIRGFLGSMLILLPINTVLLFVMEDLLLMVGEDPESSRLAAEWYRIYVIALPFYALFMVQWKFLSSQETMLPLMIVVFLSVGIILPVSLHWFIPLMGFIGSAYAILIYLISQSLLLLAYLIYFQPHHPETWTGLSSSSSWREAMAYEPFVQFMILSAGGMLASGEWIWWEFISLMVGTLGIIPLSVHTIPTQVLTVAFMLPMGIGTGLSIRLGTILPRNVKRARQLAWWTCILSIGMFVLVSILLYTQRSTIIGTFSSDPQVLDGAEDIWWKVCVYFFILCSFGVLSGIAVGLGMQWTLGVVGMVFLWFIGLPGLYLNAIVYHGGLGVAWSWIFPPYLGMNVLLAYKFLTTDWDYISLSIRVREGIDHEPLVTADGACLATTTTTTTCTTMTPTTAATEHTPLLV